jgi:hypothetical protein
MPAGGAIMDGHTGPHGRRAFRRAAAVALSAALGTSGVLLAGDQTQSPQPASGSAAQPGQSAGGQGRGGGRGQARELPIIPGTPWRIHDMARPRPPVVTPGTAIGAPPSDAIVLFDGKDLSKWVGRGGSEPKWPIRDGYVETGAKTGSITTRDRFGSIQLHLEFATPATVTGSSQGRGNSGVIFMGLYEIQVLDSYGNDTYPDGMAAAIYGDWPPLVNAARKPGEWQTYDIIFEAPVFNGSTLVSPAYATVFWNGVIVHNRQRIAGPTSPTQTVHSYSKPHDPELPLTLQDHSNPVRYRNIWVRRLAGYDGQGK